MSKYLIKASYSAEGIQGLKKAGGTSRVTAVEKMVSGLGGSLESFYFAFGGDDVLVVVDVPGPAEAAAVAANVSATGAMSHYETVALLTPQEVDEAMQLAVEYSPPGS